MLTAYFDDSGTHDQSDIVIWAGLFGDQYQWKLLDELWAAKLDDPCPGKEPIKQFHMVDCEHGDREFLYWKRHEREYLARELAEIIDKCMLRGAAHAVSRKDWDELITGTRRDFHGDAEAFSMRTCYGLAMVWALEHAAYDKELAVVFDSRPHRNQQNRAAFDAIERERERRKLNLANQALPNEASNILNVDLVSVTFSSAAKFRPLQAADMFAFEFYQNANEVIRGDPDAPKRDLLRRLLKSKRLRRAISSRKEVEFLARSKEIDYARLAAESPPPNWILDR